MAADLDGTQVIATVAILGWLGTVVFAVLKGRDLVAKMALEAVGSIEGRTVVHAIVTEKYGRIEEKLDSLASSVAGMGQRLEGRIDAMSNKLEAQLARLDADARDVEVRLALIEDKRGGRREER